jgi:uncharacterized membrane protein
MTSVLLLALLVRLVNLDQSLWLDEAAQAMESARPLAEQWQIRADFHPPFFHYLLHFWMQGGSTEWYLRLISVLAGVATVGVVYLIGKEVGGKKVGKLAALFLSIAPYHIYYSQELRMYVWSALWAALAVYFLLKRNWWGQTLALVGGVYTLYLFWLMVPVGVIWLWLKDREWLGRYLLSWGVATLAFLPWVPQLLVQLEGGLVVPQAWPEWGEISSVGFWRAVPLTFAKFSLGRISFSNKLVYGGLVGIAGVVMGWPVWKARREKVSKEEKKDDGLLIWLWLLVPFGLAWVVSLWVPVNAPWRLLFILPAMYLLVAVGLGNLGNLGMRKVLIAGVVGVGMVGTLLYWFNPSFQREDWRGAVRFVQERLDEGSVVVFAFPDALASYKWYAADPRGYGAIEGLVATPKGVDLRMGEIMEGMSMVWRFEYLEGLTDVDGLILGWLERNGFEEIKGYDFEGVGIVWEYER